MIALSATWAVYAADAAAPAAAGTSDVKAERARRDALRQVNRAEEAERFKKSGAAYLVQHVEPKFPVEAKTSYHVLKVTIKVDETGVVRGVLFPDKPEPLFELAALEAIWQWRYSPQKVDGKPVRADVFEIISFARPAKKATQSPQPPPVSAAPRAKESESKSK